MEQTQIPVLTIVPFEGDEMKLTSFAENLVCGPFRIGQGDTKDCNIAGPKLIFFNDFRNPEITYTATCAQAFDATRYIASLSLKRLIEIESVILKNEMDSAPEYDPELDILSYNHSAIRMGYMSTRLTIYKSQLAQLKVSDSVPALPKARTHDQLDKYITFVPQDTDTDIEFKTGKIIETLKQWKKEPLILREIALDRFYHFWSCADLEIHTKNDKQRNLEELRTNRASFFHALSTQDTNTLQGFADGKKSIIKRETLSVFGVVDRMISYHEQYKHLNPRSPENSDDEAY